MDPKDPFDTDIQTSAEIIELAKHQDHKTPRINNAKPKGADKNRVQLINRLCRQTINRSEAGNLTAQEEMFCQQLVSGDSMADAYEIAYPEKCWDVVPVMKKGEHLIVDGEPQYERVPLLTYNQRFNRGNSLTKAVAIRSRIIVLLEAEEEETPHTARRLDNLIVKGLEKEATSPLNSAAARIAALDKLSKHRAVQVAEAQAAKRAEKELAPEDLIDQIKQKIARLTPTSP